MFLRTVFCERRLRRAEIIVRIILSSSEMTILNSAFGGQNILHNLLAMPIFEQEGFGKPGEQVRMMIRRLANTVVLSDVHRIAPIYHWLVYYGNDRIVIVYVFFPRISHPNLAV